MKKPQELLYIWLKEVGCVRYERIKQVCEYLNTYYSLSLDKPINLFYPLLRSGVVDMCADGKFQTTPPCIITKDNRNTIISNPQEITDYTPTEIIGIYKAKGSQYADNHIYKFNAETILCAMPTVKECVETYETYYYSESDFPVTYGISKKQEDAIITYLIDEKKKISYKVPSPSSNPDAKNIASAYDKALRSLTCGTYDTKTNTMSLNFYSTPIMLYRILMLETMLADYEIQVKDKLFIFNAIGKRLYKEVNRIMCNTIICK